MRTDSAESRHRERQISYARVVFLVLALTSLFLDEPPVPPTTTGLILWTYLGAALILLWFQRSMRSSWRVPITIEIATLALILLVTPSIVPFWLVYLFVAWTAGVRWGLQRAVELAAVVTVAVLLHATFYVHLSWMQVLSWAPLLAGTSAAGIGLSFLGDRYRRQASEHELLARLVGMLKVEQGTAESLRLMLSELARAFQCEQALLALRDNDLERLFVWNVSADQTERLSPENRPLSQTDGFLLNRTDAAVCCNQLDPPRRTFGWDRNTGRALSELPLIAEPLRKELGLRSFMSVPLDFEGQNLGRIMLCNSKRRWWPQDLHWFELVVRHLALPLHNLFLLRHMRARAIEGERSRISRDIHDGILQTLLSVNMQLTVIHKAMRQDSAYAAAELQNLQETIRSETEELRRMVTDMRPMGVESADLVEIMRSFAERFRNESGIALDLLIDASDLQAPDRVCRDLFQIYREALHNVKKHAQATHVVVKMWQDDSQVTLMIDDNGRGFSFTGRYMGDELERLRLGPISIKERAKSVGGLLTVESTPGYGARLTIEVPLGADTVQSSDAAKGVGQVAQ
jgi:signal transduction histidine kinase